MQINILGSDDRVPAVCYFPVSDTLFFDGDKILHGEVFFMPARHFQNKAAAEQFMRVSDKSSLKAFCAVGSEMNNQKVAHWLVKLKKETTKEAPIIYLIPGKSASEVIAEATTLRQTAAKIRQLQGEAQEDEMVSPLSLDNINEIAVQKCSQVYQVPYINIQGQVIWDLHAKDLITLLFHEFFDALGGKHVDRCAFCGHYFYRTRSDNIYCNDTCRGSASSRAYRKKLHDPKGRGRKRIPKANAKDVHP